MTPEEDAHGSRATGPQRHLPALHFHVFEQLKQRNVLRVAALYLVVCWLILEPVHVIFHMLEVPAWANRLVLMIMAVGFPAAAIFAWVYEVTPEGLKPTIEVPHGQSIRKHTARRLDIAIIAVLAVALAYFVADKFWISKHVERPQSAASAATETAARGNVAPTATAFAPSPHSIAVLPFINLSGGQEQEYFSDGLTEELLNSLAEIEGLQVAARTSAFSFKGKDNDIGTIGRKLNVATVLEGSVRRSEHTIRVTAQLINAVTGFHLWSKTYDRDLGDVLKLQTEIATAVASALKVTLLGDVATKIELGGTRNPAAFDAYLRGRKAALATHSDKDYQTAIGAFTQAIGLDPNYALAYANRSLAFTNYAGEVSGPEIRGSFEKALIDARKAIALAPDLAEGHVALALYFETGELDFTQANEEYERALALAPGDARVLRNSGIFATFMGRTEAGLVAARRAVVLDPLNAFSHSGLGQVLYYGRQNKEAIAPLRDALALDPEDQFGLLFSGLAYYAVGDFEHARASCETKPDYWESQWCLAVTYDKLGRHADAEGALAKYRASMGDAGAYEYATIYAQWGEIPKALEWLDTAMRLRDGGLEALKTDPFMDPLRKEPRFQAALRELKFPD
jgi:serine/threonine-protein kinase